MRSPLGLVAHYSLLVPGCCLLLHPPLSPVPKHHAPETSLDVKNPISLFVTDDFLLSKCRDSDFIPQCSAERREKAHLKLFELLGKLQKERFLELEATFVPNQKPRAKKGKCHEVNDVDHSRANGKFYYFTSCALFTITQNITIYHILISSETRKRGTGTPHLTSQIIPHKCCILS